MVNPRKFSPQNIIFHEFVKVFSLESFPLYGILVPHCYARMTPDWLPTNIITTTARNFREWNFFANFMELGPFVKGSLWKVGHVPRGLLTHTHTLLHYTACSSIMGVSNPIFSLWWIHEIFLSEIVFVKVFSLESFPLYDTMFTTKANPVKENSQLECSQAG